MAVSSKRHSISEASTELFVLPDPVVLPDENKSDYLKLRRALFDEMAPATQYEALLVDDIVSLQWEIYRYRRIRDELISCYYKRSDNYTCINSSLNSRYDDYLEVNYLIMKSLKEGVDARNIKIPDLDEMREYVREKDREAQEKRNSPEYWQSKDGKSLRALLDSSANSRIEYMKKQEENKAENTAKAYQEVAASVDLLDRKITTNEQRRRKLREEFCALKAERAREIKVVR